MERRLTTRGERVDARASARHVRPSSRMARSPGRLPDRPAFLTFALDTTARERTMIAPGRIITAAAAALLAAAPALGAKAEEQLLRQLRERAVQLTIPGLAYAVVRDGRIETGSIATGDGPGLTPASPLRIASVTKAFTAVLLMRAVQARKLSLDDSASKWLREFDDRPEITVRHLAAHVSEGIPGTEYVYGTTRYSRLGDILTQVYGVASYEAALRREIFGPAGLTWHESPGLGAHAALVSTVDDVARFAAALQKNVLISADSFELMTSPPVSGAGLVQPVGVGFFSQVVGGERVVWSFGQDDPDYGSALLLLVPKRKLALVLLANTDELSNPFRLLMGNIRTSPFATAFLDAYAPDLARDVGRRDREVMEMLARLHSGDVAAVVRQFGALAAREPVSRADDFGLQFIAAMLAPQLPRGFVESIDANVVAAHARNRWALLMSGGIQNALGNPQLALERYERLLTLPNQEPDGLARLFRAWAYSGMATAVRTTDRARARRHVEDGLATGVTGGTQAALLELQKQLAEPTQE
jgi:CubicO group peptidase (beta-lactamase class C family)